MTFVEAIQSPIILGWAKIFLTVFVLFAAFILVSIAAGKLLKRRRKEVEITDMLMRNYICRERERSGTIKHNGVDSVRERL